MHAYALTHKHTCTSDRHCMHSHTDGNTSTHSTNIVGYPCTHNSTHHNLSITAGTYISHVLQCVQNWTYHYILLNCVSCINSVCCVLSIHVYMQYFPSVLQVCGHCPNFRRHLQYLTPATAVHENVVATVILAKREGNKWLYLHPNEPDYILPSACLGEGSVTYSTQIL